MSDLIWKILSSYTVLPTQMVGANQVRVILEHIEETINIPGDLVEFGCNEGTTSLFISRFLELSKSEKHFHVYDSFQGLPDKNIKDGNTSPNFVKGSCSTSRSKFETNFFQAGLIPPEIHEGWFEDIKKESIPERVSFAFLDGDFYSSILDSLSKVYIRMPARSRIIIHDYNNPALPGVATACSEFLADKPEQIIESGCAGLGLLIKE